MLVVFHSAKELGKSSKSAWEMGYGRDVQITDLLPKKIIVLVNFFRQILGEGAKALLTHSPFSKDPSFLSALEDNYLCTASNVAKAK